MDGEDTFFGGHADPLEKLRIPSSTLGFDWQVINPATIVDSVTNNDPGPDDFFDLFLADLVSCGVAQVVIPPGSTWLVADLDGACPTPGTYDIVCD